MPIKQGKPGKMRSKRERCLVFILLQRTLLGLSSRADRFVPLDLARTREIKRKRATG
jgi:hypothetical protein